MYLFDSSVRVERALIERLTAAFGHGGLNGERIFVVDNVGVGHRRLRGVTFPEAHSPCTTVQGGAATCTTVRSSLRAELESASDRSAFGGGPLRAQSDVRDRV